MLKLLQYEASYVQITFIFQIQQRWASKYTTPKDYTDYEITKDPNEWKYVECLFGYKTVPKPPTGDIQLPSGYKPASGKQQLLNIPIIINFIRFVSRIFSIKNT